MEQDYTSYAKLELTHEYKYLTIDLANKFFEIHIVNVENQNVMLKVSIDLNLDKVEIKGDIEKYPYNIDDTICSLKSIANHCIENNISDPTNF
ncbi:hypothetical protein BW897_21455 [Bacillus cereus]|uniref:Uncharacterized protein n=1 Tax=Bacillus cereus TaxID=1396 RepID=A0A1S9TL46_BACCE|nr:hypothetical protein [Bacillus cereus]KZD42988.1 hypothetical protein B4083_1304 [Bacillus cereus]OOR10746.1 hypothetical protein BW897_21455 [Bacillus cereus]QBP90874.1 hypothetical protein E1A90_05555 [Bacillus mycoides]